MYCKVQRPRLRGWREDGRNGLVERRQEFERRMEQKVLVISILVWSVCMAKCVEEEQVGRCKVLNMYGFEMKLNIQSWGIQQAAGYESGSSTKTSNLETK